MNSINEWGLMLEDSNTDEYVAEVGYRIEDQRLHDQSYKRFQIVFSEWMNERVSRVYFIKRYYKYIYSENMGFIKRCENNVKSIIGEQIEQLSIDDLVIMGVMLKALNDIIDALIMMNNDERWKLSLVDMPWKIWYRTRSTDPVLAFREISSIMDKYYGYLIVILRMLLMFIRAYDDFVIQTPIYKEVYAYIFDTLMMNSFLMSNEIYKDIGEFNYWHDLRTIDNKLRNIYKY